MITKQETSSNQTKEAIIFIATALTPLVVVPSIAIGQAANANDYHQRGTWSYKQGTNKTHCSIGCGRK